MQMSKGKLQSSISSSAVTLQKLHSHHGQLLVEAAERRVVLSVEIWLSAVIVCLCGPPLCAHTKVSAMHVVIWYYRT